MAQVIAVNASYAGSGVSTTVANTAALMALLGVHAGVVDACLTAPTLHLLFGLSQSAPRWTLNDYLLGRCSLSAAAQRVPIGNNSPDRRSLLVVPADPNHAAVVKAYRQAYDVESLGESCQKLAADLGLDVLIIDTEAGLPPSTLNCMAAANAALILLAPDKQHFQGVARTVSVVEALAIPRHKLAVNSVVPLLDDDEVRIRVSQIYGWEVAAVIPYCDALMALGSASVFVLRYPTHSVTARFHQIAASLL